LVLSTTHSEGRDEVRCTDVSIGRADETHPAHQRIHAPAGRGVVIAADRLTGAVR
jgi:hypothetical protein